jgi:hypothetical protein
MVCIKCEFKIVGESEGEARFGKTRQTRKDAAEICFKQ